MSVTQFIENETSFAQKLFDDVRALSIDGPGVSRQGYGPVESKVVDYLLEVGRRLGLETNRDVAGNWWMTMPGKDRSLPAIVAGSHADSVPQGGNYDGLAGIVAALCVAHWLREQHIELCQDFTVLILRCEESSYFGKAYVGSLGMMGRLSENDLALQRRDGQQTLGDAMRSCGVMPEQLITGHPVIDTQRIAAFIELHIEQGPMLDSRLPARVGIVTGIRGNIRHKTVVCHGETAHSGAVDKAFRHDAVMATASLIHQLEARWQSFLDDGQDLVFTVGVLNTAPTAAISVIPGEVKFTIDIRSLSEATCEAFHQEVMKLAQVLEQKRGVRFTFDSPLRTLPGHVDSKLSDRLYRSAERIGIPCVRLPSGAGHDTAVISAAGIPSAMIFVANQHGSHNPHEAMKIEDFMAGCSILMATVVELEK